MALDRVPLRLRLLCLVIIVVVSPMAESRCSERNLSSSTTKLYSFCDDLPALGSTLRWSRDPASSLLHVAFSAAPPAAGGWISWGINPSVLAMIGTQALLAFRSSNGSMDVGTYNIDSYKVKKSEIEFEVSDLGAEFGGDGVMTIFATLKLPAGVSKVYQVWQVGPGVVDGVPTKHSFDPESLAARSILDLSLGGIPSPRSRSRIHQANIHGVLNAVGWGILIPIGGIIARYLRAFEAADPAWLYLHAACQISGYAVGIAGWATGIRLGNQSKGIQRTTHRAVGIAIFTLATLQLLSAFTRPDKKHKLRIYWNAWHHLIGYAVIAMGIFNIFNGFSILKPSGTWTTAYIAVIGSLGAVAVILEILTWALHFRRKPTKYRPTSG